MLNLTEKEKKFVSENPNAFIICIEVKKTVIVHFATGENDVYTTKTEGEIFPAEHIGHFRKKLSKGRHLIAFEGKLTRIILTDGESHSLLAVIQWGNIKWESMERMFFACNEDFSLPKEVPDLSNVTNMGSMFRYAKSFNQPLESWNVSNVTNMSDMFDDSELFNQPLEKWNVSNVMNMGWMFCGAKSFNQPLEKWNVSNVTNMSGMFMYADSFNQPLEKWDVSNVTNMSCMFWYATSFNQPLEKWNIKR